MPIQSCSIDGKPGFKFGDGGTCFGYTTGNAQARAQARARAERQGRAIEANKGYSPGSKDKKKGERSFNPTERSVGERAEGRKKKRKQKPNPMPSTLTIVESR